MQPSDDACTSLHGIEIQGHEGHTAGGKGAVTGISDRKVYVTNSTTCVVM
jgi:hypothetical protein